MQNVLFEGKAAGIVPLDLVPAASGLIGPENSTRNQGFPKMKRLGFRVWGLGFRVEQK